MNHKKICFICHGNICRSPMAEFVLKEMLVKSGLEGYSVVSRATSFEEIGNDMHYGTKAILEKYKIPFLKHEAIHLEKQDYHCFDYFIGMDSANVKNSQQILDTYDGRVIFRLLDLTQDKRDIMDPWYTGDFEQTYQDIVAGCKALITMLKNDSSFQ